MMYMRLDKTARCFWLVSILLWASLMTNDVAATLTDDHFTCNSKCHIGLQERPLPSPARDTTNEFDKLPENTVCNGTQDVVLKCVSKSRLHDVRWEVQTKTARCRLRGRTTGGQPTLLLPCASYTVQCLTVSPATGQVVTRSPAVHITKDNEAEAQTHYCMEGKFNFVTSFRHAPVEEVLSTRWSLGGEECPPKLISSHGLQLDLPCMPTNQQKEVSCIVEFRDGIVNKTIGRIRVNKWKSNQPVGQKVNKVNGVTATKLLTATPTPETHTEKTIHLTPKELSIAIAVILFAFLVILVSVILLTFRITYNCTRPPTGGNEKDNGPEF